MNKQPEGLSDGRMALRGFAAEVGMRTKPLEELIAQHDEFSTELVHQVSRANAAIRLTGWLLRFLPWIMVVIEQLLGLNVIQTLTSTFWGWAIFFYCSLLSMTAGQIMRRFNEKTTRLPHDPGIWFAAMAQALRDGVSMTRAANALRAWIGIGPGSWRRTNIVLGGTAAEVEAELAKALEQGHPAAKRLEEIARFRRGEVRKLKELQIAMLPIRLLIPVAAFLLPAFLVTVIAPTVLSLFFPAHTSI